MIQKVIAAEQHYVDLQSSIFKAELQKWADLLSQYH